MTGSHKVSGGAAVANVILQIVECAAKNINNDA